jgi:hypothetical protein
MMELCMSKAEWTAVKYASQAAHDEALARGRSMAKAYCLANNIRPDDWLKQEDCPEWEIYLALGMEMAWHFDRLEAERKDAAAIRAAVAA